VKTTPLKYLFLSVRLEAEEKFITAEGLYRKALALTSFPDAKEALGKIELLIQVSWYIPWVMPTIPLVSHLRSYASTSFN
jgi:hypothetical protein